MTKAEYVFNKTAGIAWGAEASSLAGKVKKFVGKLNPASWGAEESTLAGKAATGAPQVAIPGTKADGIIAKVTNKAHKSTLTAEDRMLFTGDIKAGATDRHTEASESLFKRYGATSGMPKDVATLHSDANRSLGGVHDAPPTTPATNPTAVPPPKDVKLEDKLKKHWDDHKNKYYIAGGAAGVLAGTKYLMSND